MVYCLCQMKGTVLVPGAVIRRKGESRQGFQSVQTMRVEE